MATAEHAGISSKSQTPSSNEIPNPKYPSLRKHRRQIRRQTCHRIGGFAEYLQDPENRLHPSFELRGEGLRRYQFNNPATIPAVHIRRRR